MMAGKTESIETKLAKLATKIADEALADDVLLETRLDSFKALTAYHVGVSRVKSKDPTDSHGGPSIAELQRRIAVAASRPGSGNSRPYDESSSDD
jgi:hypothetical protein